MKKIDKVLEMLTEAQIRDAARLYILAKRCPSEYGLTDDDDDEDNCEACNCINCWEKEIKEG